MGATFWWPLSTDLRSGAAPGARFHPPRRGLGFACRAAVSLRLCALVALSSCFHPVSFDGPLPDDGTFADGKPTVEQRERCRLAAEYSKSKVGYAVLILEDDKVTCENYHGGTTEPVPHHLWSGTKSFSCALAVALELGWDDRVSETLTEWKDDAKKSQITVAQLLSFTSGLSADETRLSADGVVERPAVGDKYAVAAAQPAETEPGERFAYGSQHLMAFGAYVRRLTGEDPLDLLESRVFSKLGFRYAGWIRDPAGNAALPYGAFTTNREWAKFGSLLLHEGRWRGEQVLSAEGLAACRAGSEVMPSYGLTFWLNAEVTKEQLAAADTPVKQRLYPDGPGDLYAAAGRNNERLFVIPSRNMLVLRQGGADESWSDAAFLARALDGHAP